MNLFLQFFIFFKLSNLQVLRHYYQKKRLNLLTKSLDRWKELRPSSNPPLPLNDNILGVELTQRLFLTNFQKQRDDLMNDSSA